MGYIYKINKKWYLNKTEFINIGMKEGEWFVFITGIDFRGKSLL